MRFTRLHLPGLFVGVLALTLVACGGGGGGTPDASDDELDLVVVQELPTNRQEVSGLLPEVDGRIEIQFSTAVDENTILDPSNPFNGLSANLNMLDRNLIRVPGTPEVNGRYFRFIPPSTGLAPQQYTVSVTRNVLSKGGSPMPTEFYSSFTVGPDGYPPIIRRTFPVQNQQNVPRESTIRITFNESLDPGSVNTQTVIVQDGGQNPPVTINGTIALINNNFEILFTPDPTTTLPPNTTIVVTIVGDNGGIADQTAGLPFEGDGVNTDANGNNIYVIQFDTEAGGDPVNQFAVASLYFSDQSSFGVIDIANFTGFPPITGSSGFQVLANSRRKIGSPSEILLDPRVNGAGDTFAYVVDRSSSTVAVVNTFNSRIVGRIKCNGPRGLGIDLAGSELFISEFNSDSVAAYIVTSAQPGTNIWNKDPAPGGPGSATRENVISVGRGPTGVAVAPDQFVTFVTNTLDGTCTIIDRTTNTVMFTWQAGATPTDVAISLTFPNLGFFALVTNLGGSAGDPGSCSLWWSAAPSVQQWLVTGVVNPRGVIYDYGINYLVADSGGATISRITIAVAGNTIVPNLSLTWPVGLAPQNVAIDASNASYLFSSDRGSGTVHSHLISTNTVNQPKIEVPGVSYVATLLNQ